MFIVIIYSDIKDYTRYYSRELNWVTELHKNVFYSVDYSNKIFSFQKVN